jgi:regulator of replication initiation timing
LDFSRKLAAMSVSLDHLERKVDQMVAICASLRSENQDLRAHVAAWKRKRRR